MAITFVAAAGNNYSGSASPTTSVPAGVADNDILLAFFTTDTVHDTTGTPPTGWTKIGEGDVGADSSTSVFWKRAASEPASYAWTSIFAASETGIAIMLAYQGCFATGDPQDAAAVFGTESSTPWDTGAIVTVTDNALCVGAFGADPNSDPYTFAWDAGITERIDSDTSPTGQNGMSAYLAIGDKIITPPASTTLGGDSSVGDTPVSVIIALKPADTFVPRHPAHDHGSVTIF